jgi:hypothetical protein
MWVAAALLHQAAVDAESPELVRCWWGKRRWWTWSTATAATRRAAETARRRQQQQQQQRHHQQQQEQRQQQPTVELGARGRGGLRSSWHQSYQRLAVSAPNRERPLRCRAPRRSPRHLHDRPSDSGGRRGAAVRKKPGDGKQKGHVVLCRQKTKTEWQTAYTLTQHMVHVDLFGAAQMAASPSTPAAGDVRVMRRSEEVGLQSADMLDTWI